MSPLQNYQCKASDAETCGCEIVEIYSLYSDFCRLTDYFFVPFIILIILSSSSLLSRNCLSLSLSLLLVGGHSQCHTTAKTEHTIMAIINFTSSAVFLTAFIMTLTKNDFGIEPLTKISTNHIEL